MSIKRKFKFKRHGSEASDDGMVVPDHLVSDLTDDASSEDSLSYPISKPHDPLSLPETKNRSSLDLSSVAKPSEPSSSVSSSDATRSDATRSFSRSPSESVGSSPPSRPSRFMRNAEAQQTPQGTPARAPSSDASPLLEEGLKWASWGLDIASPVRSLSGSWLALTCPKCRESGLAAHSESGVFFCFSCPHHGDASTVPRQYRQTWLQAWNVFLKDSAQTELPEMVRSAQTEGCLAYVYQNKAWLEAWHLWCTDGNHTIRDCYISSNLNALSNEDPSWFRLEGPAYPLGWNETLQNRVVLVNDPLDLVALSNIGVSGVACVPPDLDVRLPTSDAWKALEFMESKLKDMSEIIFAFHSTPHWRALEDELGRRMDKERCFRVRWTNPWAEWQEGQVDEATGEVFDEFAMEAEVNEYQEALEASSLEQASSGDAHREEKSAFDALKLFSADKVISMIDVAQPFPVAGVHELSDLDDRFEELYKTGLAPGAATGWPSMDPHYTVKTGQWTVVTGIPGHGKSSWLDGLLVNLATLHGWRFGMFSPENQPIERHFASLMEKKIGKPFSEGHRQRISEKEKNITKRWLNDKFKVILPHEENGLWTLDAVLKLAKVLVYRYGIRGLVIDPWNELDHSRNSQVSETTYISECLTKVRRFARLYDVHIWIVAHPTKLEKKADGKYPVATPYDIAGGAHWRNKADNAISVYRNVDEDDRDVSDVYIQKIRFKEVGSLGVVSLRSDLASGAYIDDIDQNKRAYAKSQGAYLPSSSMRLPSPRKYHTGSALSYEHNF